MLTPTTRLEAINTMLRAIGETPVNTLSGSPTVDVVTAQQTLDEISREVQSDGWAFNQEKDYPILRQAFAPFEFQLPGNLLHCDPSDPSIDYVVRGTRLYDKTNHTFEFPDGPEKVLCEVIWLLDFEDLPETARRYITIRAARVFINDSVGNAEMSGFKESDERRAAWRFRKANARALDKNLLTGSVAVATILAR